MFSKDGRTLVSKEQVEEEVDKNGFWEGQSHEWRIFTYSHYKITRKDDKYLSEANCDYILSAEFPNFDSAYLFLDIFTNKISELFLTYGWPYSQK